jgi:ketosteroid isomerase-like protein
MPSDRVSLARDSYLAFAAGDRARIEELLSDDLTFSSPYDVGLDRAGYFERCWPGSGRRNHFEFKRLAEVGDDEVLVTYESEQDDGTRFRNTEVLGFRGDRIRTIEVYFGWTLAEGS